MKRLRNNLRRRVERGDVSALTIVLALLVLPILALDAAGWADGMLALLPIVGLSVALGYFLEWSRLSEGVALLVSLFYGFVIICGTMILFLASGASLPARISDFVTRVSGWFTSVQAGGTGQDNLVWVLFLAVWFWVLGHNTAWHVFRIDRVWRAIVPPGLVLIINNFQYARGDQRLDVYLILYVFVAMLLVVRSHVDAREYEWYRNKVRYPRQMRKYFLRIGAGIAAVIVVIAALLPNGPDRRDNIQNFLNSISDLSELWERLFADLEPQGLASPEYYGGDRLELGGAIQLGEQEVLEVEAPPTHRYYWRSTAFDTYLGVDGWTHNRSVRATKDDEGLELNIGALQARESVQQEFTVLLAASSLVYAAPQPIEFGLPVQVQLDCVTNAETFQCVNQGLEADASVARALNPLRRGENYSVVSSMSIANADQLRSAGTSYPAWVTDKYLQYGDRVSPRLRDLTLQITNDAGAVTPYDQAKAIERWLRAHITYDESIPAPPPGLDPVEWVVFDFQRGYCNYYASAMALMLRSLGIPSRVSAGFSQGEFNAETGRFLVQEQDAHTWVEVYFPGYGWVEFEPTASEEELNRQGDIAPSQPVATSTPLPTVTPTTPPTNTPVAPSNPEQSTPTPSPQAQEQPLVPPTPSPTPSPTPEPPIQDTTIQPDDDFDVLELLLTFLGVIVLVVVVAVSMIAFTIWWVEHRGLGGLSVVEKAYARMTIYGKWLGLRLQPQFTPEERRQLLVRGVPTGERPISDITSMYVESHFAPPEKKAQDEENALEAWSEARLAFIRQKFRRWLRRG